MTKSVADGVSAAGGCNLADFFAPTHRFHGLQGDDEDGRHATLKVLVTRSCVRPWQSLPLSHETARYKQLVEMLQSNTVLQEIRFDFQHRNAHDNSDSLLAMRALLLRNIYLRKRLPSLAAVYPSSTQLALVGRALHSANHRPNELWILLSGVLDFLLLNVASSSSKRFDCRGDTG
jgi:hypothetical protein